MSKPSTKESVEDKIIRLDLEIQDYVNSEFVKARKRKIDSLFKELTAAPIVGNTDLVNTYRRKKRLRMCCTHGDISDDMDTGHEHLNEHGIFYDADGPCMRVWMGTSCGIYWGACCKRCPPGKCCCGLQQKIRIYEIIYGEEYDFRCEAIWLALRQGYVYLMRRDEDGGKQYDQDVKS